MVILDNVKSNSRSTNAAVPPRFCFWTSSFSTMHQWYCWQYKQARHVYFLMASNTIQFSSPNVLELEVIMTHDMATILNWSRQWRMQFNALKSVFVPFTNKLLRTPVEILLINIAIKKSTAHKHLGVLLQSNCNWDSQKFISLLKRPQKGCAYFKRSNSKLVEEHYRDCI